mmetsp:Transcript_19679/g.30397  ORF Transcript_19679/g.30397 Transcript_19679/m.30397 type:complete len:159 (-) Transcript_19679:145-621(-)|eukprot:CAMPEP_0170504112 /NCGR_PEP_ID=MMETSP0208-20121228/46914_1 /TAXON_ID=197538 /ORGANISM="Strombidium inclinatum, Strain S3" /LENGTH=158 /DNA_ID=CAMNT_0010784175 /DNA_START=87 /DNA_END=563 /DNA_ORIENTATION=-
MKRDAVDLSVEMSNDVDMVAQIVEQQIQDSHIELDEEFHDQITSEITRDCQQQLIESVDDDIEIVLMMAEKEEENQQEWACDQFEGSKKVHTCPQCQHSFVHQFVVPQSRKMKTHLRLACTSQGCLDLRFGFEGEPSVEIAREINEGVDLRSLLGQIH